MLRSFLLNSRIIRVYRSTGAVNGHCITSLVSKVYAEAWIKGICCQGVRAGLVLGIILNFEVHQEREGRSL